MNWTSIDIGNLMGVTQWCGDVRKNTYLVKKMGAKGKYYHGDEVVPSRRSAILRIVAHSQFVVMERGVGDRANVVNAQAKSRGYIEAVCDEFKIPTREIMPAEWRRPIKEIMDVSWPRKGEDKKKLAQAIVKKLYNIDVSEDEADSILIGWGAFKLGYVR